MVWSKEDVSLNFFNFPSQERSSSKIVSLWEDIVNHSHADEPLIVNGMIKDPLYTPQQFAAIQHHAKQFIQQVRDRKVKPLNIEAFFKTHNLTSHEGLALMCLAEALLRIPDAATKDGLIRDKVASTSWHSQDDDMLLRKFANIGLMTASKFLSLGHKDEDHSFGKISTTIAALIRRFSEPVIRQIMVRAVRIIAQQFVMGETIESALSMSLKNRLDASSEQMVRYSYDMLGEAAKTQEDADAYFEHYKAACMALGQTVEGAAYHPHHPSISVKLSALHPRYEMAQRSQVLAELKPKILELAKLAKDNHIGLTIDAEESYRLVLSLELFYSVYTDPALDDYHGFGLAIQAYQKAAVYVTRWVIALASFCKKSIPVRLVKGAYWDTEIKHAQVHGLKGYPVFTQKHHTDVSYLTCAKIMLAAHDTIFPQFATHNVLTIAVICEFAQSQGIGTSSFECQRLHGMGDDIYELVAHQVYKNQKFGVPCRVYAPVGTYRDLLAYLVRRLLENGANSSFVKQIYDHHMVPDDLIKDPITLAHQSKGEQHLKIPLPVHLYKDRLNSRGFNLACPLDLSYLSQHIQDTCDLMPLAVTHDVQSHMNRCVRAFDRWASRSVYERADRIKNLGDIMEQNMPLLMNILIHEGRKTIEDAMNEVREAIDFCRYYAQKAIDLQKAPHVQEGPTGEQNELSYHPRGVFLCISPWNFPLAIFTGQIVAALVTGNTVLAKPASQTTMIAKTMTDMAYAAGIPQDVLVLVNASRAQITEDVLSHPKLKGVVFTGSTESAQSIQKTLAHRNGSLLPFIAETGGINAMIVDSSALAEQVVTDVIASAFQSAGQRCSALRLLCLQTDIADSILTMLKGAVQTLKMGPSHLLSTDIGPVIDAKAKEDLLSYLKAIVQIDDQQNGMAQQIFKHDDGERQCAHLSDPFVVPHILEIPTVSHLKKEVFGPILHVVRYKGEHLDQLIDEINQIGYGLTLGLHTRLESTIHKVRSKAHVGNLYVNRNMIGAVVGVQPFGGEGLSGTGFKAGGPNYLLKFVTERTFTHNTTAIGGNTSLLIDLS